MGTDGIKSVGQLLVLLHVLDKVQLRFAPVAESMQFHLLESTLIHGLAHLLCKVPVPASLVVTAQCIQLHAMHLPQSLHPGDIVVHHVIRPATAHPCR